MTNIPKIDSIQELAEFWDDRDLTDFEDQLEEVTEPIFERESIVEIGLLDRDLQEIKRMAKLQGVNYKDLIRAWVMEKVRTV
ncbi:MAG: CopG family antitoxin [Spirulinaceae cyanobacterium]